MRGRIGLRTGPVPQKQQFGSVRDGPRPFRLRAFWQARLYDFNVYTKGKTTEKLNYMHANPVIRGLVKHPKDWPRSQKAELETRD